MTKTARTTQAWRLASVALQDAYTDFMLSRQAQNFTDTTLEFYKYTAGFFLAWCEQQGLTEPREVTARYVRQYLAGLAVAGKKDTTMHAHARAIKTLLLFWKAEGYIPQPVKFEMPKLAKKRLPMLTEEQFHTVLKACNVRDRAIVMFLCDSGLRRAEACKLNWGDVSIQSGRVNVIQGKGQKDRTAAVGAKTRRALLAYRRTLTDHTDSAPLFQTDRGTRFTGSGMLSVFRRLTKITGMHCNVHAMRRTWTIFSLRAKMNALHLQNLGGWEDMEMVNRYAQMVDDDLLAEHKAHSPVDNL
jgi:site-specific recombinase XerD